jgi:hypothetical protein
MIKCHMCKADLPDEAKFCINCGARRDALPQSAVLSPTSISPAPGSDGADKMSLLKAKLSTFKVKKESESNAGAGVYSTDGYKETYPIERGSYNISGNTDGSTPIMSKQDATKVVMKPMAQYQSQPTPASVPQPAPAQPVLAPARPPSQNNIYSTSGGGSIGLKEGHCYLIEESKPKLCFNLFAHYTNGGYLGLCISRTNPKRLAQDFEFPQNSIILWLTDTTPPAPNMIPPSLERITYDIKGFVSKNKGQGTPLILFDGLEYLLSNNPFNPVIRFLRHLIDECSMNDSIMLIPLSPLAISQQELKMLERELDVLGGIA